MQHSLSCGKKNESLTTRKAAALIGVSDATIHNWVKTNYLQSQPDGRICQDSIDTFLKDYAGKEKLNARANKLQKDEHNHEQLCKEIAQKLNMKMLDDTTWQEYEDSLSESFRNKEGIYYTPAGIIIDMLKNIHDVKNKTFLDPCCGAGNFIIHAIEKGFCAENIYGFDTDINAVEITKKRILDKTGFAAKNIICGDFLAFAKHTDNKYDYIFTNPPWGKKLEKKTKDQLSIMYQTGKSKDTCSLFFFACLQLLHDYGKLGFLLPEAFFNIAAFEDARKTALHLNIERLIDYGKPFKGLVTRAQAIILKNEKADENSTVLCETEHYKETQEQKSFHQRPKHIINFWADAETNNIIEHMYSLQHITLAHNTKWGLGIVTGNNNNVCKPISEKGFVPLFRGKDITAQGLKKPALFIVKDFSRCQQAAPLELYHAKEKLIYRFISSKLVFYCDTEQRYILNSANMLILDKAFPISAQQLSDLLNSNIMNWLFKNIFHTNKILRSDLESLPIHADFFIENKNFDEEKYLRYMNIEQAKNGTYRIR